VCEREAWALRARDRHAYRLFTRPSTWAEARDACRAIGTHLATITDADEEAFVEAHASGLRWIGASAGSDRAFHWTTGEPLGFADFPATEPDDLARGFAVCVALDLDNHWHDRPCAARYAYVCEAD
jgi:hypothetical protein